MQPNFIKMLNCNVQFHQRTPRTNTSTTGDGCHVTREHQRLKPGLHDTTCCQTAPQIRSTILALYKLVCMYVCMYVCTYVCKPVVNPVWQPVGQQVVSCIQTSNRLSNRPVVKPVVKPVVSCKRSLTPVRQLVAEWQPNDQRPTDVAQHKRTTS